MSTPSTRSANAFLVILLLVLAAANIHSALTTITPPNYDPAYHLTLGLSHSRYFESPGPPSIAGFLKLSSYYPPLFYWVMTLLFWSFGASQAVGQFTGTLFLLAAVYAFFRIGWQIAGERGAAACALLAALTPGVVGFSRTMYLDLPLMALCALCLERLLASNGGANRNAMILAGVFAGLALLVKWTAPLFLALPALLTVYSGLTGTIPFSGSTPPSEPPPEVRRQRVIANSLASFAIAVLIALPWYGVNGMNVVERMGWVLGGSAAQEGDPVWHEPRAWVFYLFGSECILLHMPLTLLTLAALGFAILRARQRPVLALLAACWFTGYAALTFLHNKDARYAMPLLAFSVPISAALIVQMLGSKPGRTAVIALFLYSFTAFLDLSFAFPFLPKHLVTPTPFGELIWWSKARSGSTLGARENWRNRELLEWAIENAPPRQGRELNGVVLTNHWSLNSQTLRLESQFQRLPVHLEMFQQSDSFNQRATRLLDGDFLITKTGEGGPAYTQEPARFAMEDLALGEHSFIRQAWPVSKTFDLPDGSTATLFVLGQKTERPWLSLDYRYNPPATLHRLRIEQPVIRKGEQLVFETEWTLHQPLNSKLALFIHLDASDDRTLLNELAWLAEDLPDPAAIGRMQASRHRFSVPIDSEIEPGVYAARVGVWDTAADVLLEAETPAGPRRVQELPVRIWCVE